MPRTTDTKKKGAGLQPDAFAIRTTNSADFKRLARLLGTNSRRYMRALWALMHLPEVSRESVDRYARASNGPMVISELRRLFGIEIPCKRVPVRDADGHWCYPGRYSLTPADRAKVCAHILRHGEG